MLNDWLKHIEFAYPWVLGALLLLPILIIEYIRRNKKPKASLMLTTTHFVQPVRTAKVVFQHVPFILRSVTLVLLIVALARPQTKYTEEQTDGEGIDIVLCFDISGSMAQSQDFKPSRLEVAKQLASDFVNGRPGDRIGITIFSKISFTLCPLTTDHSTVISQIQNIHPGYLVEEGTSVGSGVATSVDRLRVSDSKTKIIILLTDGVDFGGEVQPDVALEMAKKYGVKIYTIGIGSNRIVDEEVQGDMGTFTQKKKLEYNENLLQLLANETGGKYFQAIDKAAMQKIYENINLLERSKIQTTQFTRFTDHYYGLVIIAMILLVIELLLRYTVFRRFP